MDLNEFILKAQPSDGINGPKGLIQQHDLRIDGKCPNETHALLLPAESCEGKRFLC